MAGILDIYYIHDDGKSITRLFANRKNHRWLSIKQWITNSFKHAFIKERIPFCCILNFIFDDVVFGLHSTFLRGFIGEDGHGYVPCWGHYLYHDLFLNDIRRKWRRIRRDKR